MALDGYLYALKALYTRFYDANAASAKEEILDNDFVNLAASVWQRGRYHRAPTLNYYSATVLRTSMTGGGQDLGLAFCGFPDIDCPGNFILPASTTAWYATSEYATLDVSNSTYRWGTEKASQWYAAYAIYKAGSPETFAFKAMPLMRYSSQASQVITLRNNLNSADIGYGFVSDEFVDGLIYVLSGASKGLSRAIVANNTDDGTGGTIEYGGAALSMTQGDWFVVIPPTPCRWIQNFYNNSSGNIEPFKRRGDHVLWTTPPTFTSFPTPAGAVEMAAYFDPLAHFATVQGYLADFGETPTWASVGHPDISSYLYLMSYYTAEVPVDRAKMYCALASSWNHVGLYIMGYTLPDGLRG